MLTAKKTALVFVGIAFASLLLVGLQLKSVCSDISFQLKDLQLNSLCNTTNDFESTFEIDSKCPTSITINSLLVSISFGAKTLVQSSIPGFTINHGKNIFTVDSFFTVKDDANYSDVRAVLQQIIEGASVQVSATGQASGEVMGIRFNNLVFTQDVTPIKNDNSQSTPTQPGTGNNQTSTGVSNKYFKLVSFDSSEAVDGNVASKFVVQINSVPLDNIVVTLPDISIDIYEENFYIGEVTIKSVKFGNGSSLIPLSTVLTQTELARVARKTLENKDKTSTLEFVGKTPDSSSKCVVQQVLSGVKLGSVPVPQYSIEDIVKIVGLPSISIGDVVETATVHFSVPLSLDIQFNQFVLPNMEFSVAAALVTTPIVDLQLNQFVLTPYYLSFTIEVQTVNPKLFQGWVNSFISQVSYPIDIQWVVGGHTIFEVIAYDLRVNYQSILNSAKDFASSHNLRLEDGQASRQEVYPYTVYSASVGVRVGYYYDNPSTLFQTGKMPLYYQGNLFASGSITITRDSGVIRCAAEIAVSEPGEAIVHEMWEDLQNNRLPPGILIIAPGNPNYPLGNIIQDVLRYFGEQHFNPSDTFYFSTLGSVDFFRTGKGSNNVWMETRLRASDDLVRVLKLDKLSIHFNTGTISAVQVDGNVISGRLSSSFYAPVFDVQFYMNWNPYKKQ